MENQEKHLENLTEIRSMMERSSRFISLNGLSGVFAGVFALIGAAIAHFYIINPFLNPEPSDHLWVSLNLNYAAMRVAVIAGCVLVASLTVGYLFTSRKAKKKGLPIWDTTAKRLLINLMIPLATGGLFCWVLFLHGFFILIAPATLIFYGLALVNASKYTLHDIRNLGICEIILGLIATLVWEYSLVIWAAGFGVLHIIYGTAMYYKYER